MIRIMLEKLIEVGRLTVVNPNRTRMSFGEVPVGEPRLDVVIRIRDSFTLLKLALNPELYFGEAFMEGTLTIEQGTLWDLMEILGRNMSRYRHRTSHGLSVQARLALRRLQQYNPPDRSRRNAAHHYDLSNTLYEGFLDKDLQYSCGYFQEPGLSLEQAQAAKKRHIAAKLLLERGQHVLDIGCGWGGLALYFADIASVRATGVTLSQEQLVVARERARKAGQSDNVRFELLDYRNVEGKFERIVSVGMFEHVGAPHYDEFFAKIGTLLTDDGMALIHSIGRMSRPGATNAWLRKYVFPGGYSPPLSEVLAAVERSGLWITDLEIWRLHYASTLRHWRERFLKNRQYVARLYDERFCRMWEFYLAASEMSFRYDDLMVFQLQLSKRLDVAPLTRDYMIDHEREVGRETIAAQ